MPTIVNPVFLVTGASSQIGDVFLPLLSEHSVDVRAWSRQPQMSDLEHVQWQLADLQDPPAPGLDITHVIHLAPLGLLPPLLVASERSLRVIAISTCSVLHKAESASAVERALAAGFKRAEEQVQAICVEKGHQLTILRPTMLYGLGRDGTVGVLQRFAKRFGFLLVPGQAQGLRQPVHVADVAQAIVQCLEHSQTLGQTYELGGRSRLTLRQLGERTLRDNGRRPRVFTLPLWPLALLVRLARLLRFRPDWDVGLLQRASQHQTVDNQRAIRDFGYAPREFDGRL